MKQSIQTKRNYPTHSKFFFFENRVAADGKKREKNTSINHNLNFHAKNTFE